jgi:outer membrane receptor protein involved in Fe transport
LSTCIHHVVAAACFGIAGLSSSAIVASAQESNAHGSVKGIVKAAETGAPVAGARISIARPERAVTSDYGGGYELRDLPVGSYDVVAYALGREPAHQTVTISGSQTATLDIALKAGSLMLSSVVVSATNSAPTEARNVAATVNVMTPQQVRQSPARETQDMLREIPGVELPRTSSQVSRTEEEVSIRGVGEGRTAVLLDGIPLTDAWGEWTDWNRAPKASIDHVEVVEGGGSNLYGNGALGGVIAFYSKPIAPGSYSLTAEGGSRDYRHTYLSAGVPIAGAFSASISGDYGQGGGYQLIAAPGAGPVDGISSVIDRNASARVDYAPSDKLSAFVSGHIFGDNRNLGTALSAENRTDGALNFGLNYGDSFGGTLTARAWTRDMRENQYQTTIGNANSVVRSLEHLTSYLHTPSYDRGAGLSWSRGNVLGFKSIGVGGDYRYISGFVDEQDYANSVANSATAHSTYGGNQAMSGVYAGGVLSPIEPLLIDIGARVDVWQNGDGFTVDSTGRTGYPSATRSAFSPRLGFTYKFAPSLSAHVAAYHAFRAPILAQLYRRSVTATQISLPNPALQPETATGYEAGADWQPTDWVQMKGTIYRAQYHDFNGFVTISAPGVTPTVRQRENVQATRSLGGEGYIALKPVEHFTLIGSLSYDDARITGLGPVPASATTFVGARVTQTPYQKATVRASYDTRTYGEWTLEGRYEGNATLSSGLTLPEFGVVDASVRKQVTREVNGFAAMENIFDRAYDVSLAGTVASPLVSVGIPRTFRLGVEIDRY